MLLKVDNLKKTFKAGGTLAVDDVSFGLEKGRTLGIVGESGSGKSTLLKLVLGLLDADQGRITFEGNPVDRADRRQMRDLRRKVGLIFQNPTLSLDPRMRIYDTLREPLIIGGEKNESLIQTRLKELIHSVELPSHFLSRYPHQLSGGECQRVAVARAVSMDPVLLLCDEPVSALDRVTQIQILNLLLKLQQERGVSCLFVSHDLGVVRHMSDEILVLKDGRCCEYGERDEIFQRPKHPYTRFLVQSVR